MAPNRPGLARPSRPWRGTVASVAAAAAVARGPLLLRTACLTAPIWWSGSGIREGGARSVSRVAPQRAGGSLIDKLREKGGRAKPALKGPVEETEPVSSALPPGSPAPELGARIHGLLSERPELLSYLPERGADFLYSTMDAGDAQELLALQKECFPEDSCLSGVAACTDILSHPGVVAIKVSLLGDDSAAPAGFLVLLASRAAIEQFSKAAVDNLRSELTVPRCIPWDNPDRRELAYVSCLGTIGEIRRRGAAAELLRRGLEELRSRADEAKGLGGGTGLRAVALDVAGYNKAAIRCYENFGFQRIMEQPRVYSVGTRSYSAILYAYFPEAVDRNFVVGAHYWNFQDEVAAIEEASEDANEPKLDHNRMHSSVEHRGETSWRPRLVLVAGKGALGAARAYGKSYDEETAAEAEAAHSVLWGAGIEVLRAVPVETHRYQRHLEQEEDGDGDEMYDDEGPRDMECQDDEMVDTVEVGVGDDTSTGNAWRGDGAVSGGAASSTAPSRSTPGDAADIRTPGWQPDKYDFRHSSRTWTDYLKVQLPDSCIHEMQAVHHGVSPFPLYWDGLEARGRQDEEAILDLVRKQIELCDQPDAVQVVYDMHDGFGGVADMALRWVREELPKSGKLVFAVQPELPEVQRQEGSGVDGSSAASAGAASAEAEKGLVADFGWERKPAQPAHSEFASAPLDQEACAWVSSAFSF
ncbi:unnamed protein product, partial [Polarella glacialis]